MFNLILKVTSYTLAVLFLASCQNSADPTNDGSANQQSATNQPTINQPHQIPIVCKQPAQVEDIWKLEPILIKNGEITESMTQEQKEQIIKSYIIRKNKQYKICLKGNKDKGEIK